MNLSLGDGSATLRVVGDVTMDSNRAISGNGGALHLGTGTSLEAIDGCQSVTLNAITSTGEWGASPSDGWLVIAAIDDADGSVLPSCCVDHLGRATRISRSEILGETPSGTHTVTFCLRPGSYTASWASPFGANVDQAHANFMAVLMDASTSVDGEVLFAQTSAPATFSVRA